MFLKKNSSMANAMYSLMMKIVLTLIIFISVMCIIFHIISFVHGTVKTLSLQSITAADRISWCIKSYKNIAEDIGTTPELSIASSDIHVKEMLLDSKSREYDFLRVKTIRKDGYSDMDDQYRGNREYFKEALKGNVVISDPLVSRTDGQIAIVVAAPVWRGGVPKGTLDSVVFCSLKPSFLNEIISNLNVTKRSSAYIISSEGNIVAHKDEDLILAQKNSVKEASIQSRYNGKISVERKALFGEYGTSIILDDFNICLFSTSPIKESPGWTLVIRTPITDFLSPLFIFCGFLLALVVFCIVFVRKFSLNFSKELSTPLEIIAKRLKKAANGDFTSEVEEFDSLDELNTISLATQNLINRLYAVVNEDAEMREIFSFKALLDVQLVENLRKNFIAVSHIEFCLRNVDSTIFIGTAHKEKPDAEEKITVFGRQIGTLELYVLENCPKTEEECINTAKAIVTLLDNIITYNINSRRKFRQLRENEVINIKNLVNQNTMVSEKLHEILNVLKAKKAILGENYKTVYEINCLMEKLDESSDYGRFFELSDEIEETEYTAEHFISELRDQLRNVFVAAPKDINRKFFGDESTILRLVRRIAINLKALSPLGVVAVYIDWVSVFYSSTMIIKIVSDKDTLPENEVERLGMMIDGSLKGSEFNNFEHKIVGSFNLVDEMNGKVKVSSETSSSSLAGENVVITISIPQLPIKIEGEK